MGDASVVVTNAPPPATSLVSPRLRCVGCVGCVGCVERVGSTVARVGSTVARVVGFVGLVGSALASGCLPPPEQLGSVQACLFSDSSADGFFIDEVHEGVTVAAFSDDVGCGFANSAVFVDDAGRTVSVGVDVYMGDRSVLPPHLFASIDPEGPPLRLVVQQGGFFLAFATVVLTQGERLILAVQSAATLQEDAGGLTVTDAGTGFGGVNACGTPVDPVALRFAGDDGDAQTAPLGESVNVDVDGRDTRAINVHSVRIGQSKCPESEPSNTTQVSWVAFDNTL